MHPHPGHWQDSVRRREVLALCKHCSVIAKKEKNRKGGMLSTLLLTDPKHSTLGATQEEVNSIPAETSTLLNGKTYFKTNAIGNGGL